MVLWAALEMGGRCHAGLVSALCTSSLGSPHCISVD